MIIWKLARIGAGIAAALLILSTLIGALGVALGGRAGYRAYAMQTSSMSPLIKPGDLVLVHAVPVQQIHVGDVISFQSPLSALQVTHRVVGVSQGPTGPVFDTRGDANAAPDPWHLTYRSNGWELAGVVPGGAAALAGLSRPLDRLVIAALLFAIVFMLLLPSPEKRTQATRAVAT